MLGAEPRMRIILEAASGLMDQGHTGSKRGKRARRPNKKMRSEDAIPDRFSGTGRPRLPRTVRLRQYNTDQPVGRDRFMVSSTVRGGLSTAGQIKALTGPCPSFLRQEGDGAGVLDVRGYSRVETSNC